MNPLPIAHFSAPVTNLTPLPAGPVLQLPGGLLGVFNHGRVLVHGRWVIAVGVAPSLFVVLGPCSARYVPLVLKEQLAGYLTACGAEVLRLHVRFPVLWLNAGDLARTFVFWINRLVASLSISTPPSLAITRPRLALPIGEMASRARQEWGWIGVIWNSIKTEYPQALAPLDYLLWETSHAWELRWGLTLRDAEQMNDISLPERFEVERCDRVWVGLIREYLEPHGYAMLPDTVARLL
jgi:hypothetical protein